MPDNKKRSKYGPLNWVKRQAFDPEARKAANEYYRLYRQRPEVKARLAQKNKEWRKTEFGKETVSKYRLTKYGITIEQYNAQFEKQGNACAICETKEPGKRGWCVDHCHKTGRFRGILCCNCNLGIGNLKESLFNLFKSIIYLSK